MNDPMFLNTIILKKSLETGNFDNLSIGDKLLLNDINGSNTKYIIIAKNQDIDENNETVPLTLMMVNVTNNKYYMNNDGDPTNAYIGWSLSNVRKLCQTDFYNSYDDFIKEHIVPVKKKTLNKTSSTNPKYENTIDTVFILSICERTNNQFSPILNEGNHYSIFDNVILRNPEKCENGNSYEMVGFRSKSDPDAYRGSRNSSDINATANVFYTKMPNLQLALCLR